MTTIELAPAILDHLNQEPEERKYWRSGYQMRSGVDYCKESVVVCDSESAAWKIRENYAAEPTIYFRATASPYEITREQATGFARSMGCRAVQVLDEQDQIVEEWSV